MTKKQKKVWLSISGTVKNEPENKQEMVEFLTEGNLYKEGESTCITYEESEVSGMEGTITTVKVQDQMVSVIRLGTTNSIMEFEPGKQKRSLYSTPFGDVTLGIVTKGVSVDYNKRLEPTKVLVDYNIEIAGVKNSENTLNIKITH
jgi:uncharacterized beta-barrel protein YwiB (DUF1934 family)